MFLRFFEVFFIPNDRIFLHNIQRWETEARKANSTNNGGLGTGSCYWWRNFDDSFFTEFDDKSSESRTLRLSIKAGQDLTPILHFWGVHHSDYPLLKEMHVARGLFPSKEQKDLLLKYKSLIPQESSKLQAIHYDVWVPNITKKCYSGCDEFLQRTLSWNQTMAVQAQSHVDAIIDMFWPSSGRRLGMQASSKQNYLRISSPPHIHPFNPVISRNLQVDDEFEININKWMSYGPAAKYTFTFERECLCTDGEHGPFKVTVQNGIVTDAKYALDELEASIYTEVDLNDMPTIEGLFNFTAESMKEPKNIVRVKYNNETGYPIEISVIRDDDYEEEERFENDMDEGDIDWIIIYVSYVTFGMKDEA